MYDASYILHYDKIKFTHSRALSAVFKDRIGDCQLSSTELECLCWS